MSGLTLVSLAIKHVLHRANQYLSFLLSSTFSFWLFYLYSVLLFDRAYQAGSFRDFLVAVAYLAALFSVLFVTQAHATFMESRRRDLGLLAVLGMRPGRIAATLLVENALVLLAALAGGVGLGVVFARFFVLAIGRLLNFKEAQGLHISIPAAGLTALVALACYLVLGAYTIWTTRRPIRSEQAPGAPSRRLAAAGLAAVGLAYALALTVDSWRVMEWRLAVVAALLLTGTHLLFRHGSESVLNWVQRRPGLYYFRTNLITVAQLRDRLRQGAGSLFLASLLITAVLVSLTLTLDTVRAAMKGDTRGDNVGLQIIGEPGGVGSEETVELLTLFGREVGGQAHPPALIARTEDFAGEFHSPPTGEVILLPQSGFNQWQTNLRRGVPITVPPGNGVVVRRWGWQWEEPERTLRLRFGREQHELRVQPSPDSLGLSFNEHPLTWVAVVLTDADFGALADRYGRSHGTRLHGYYLPDWRFSAADIERVEARMGMERRRPGDPPGPLTASVRSLEASRQERSYLLFLLGFAGMLFFVATGNLLFLRLYTGLETDRQRVAALLRVGVSRSDLSASLTQQTLVLFFSPMAVALAHAAVLLFMYGSAATIRPDWYGALSITVCYLFLHGLYFLAARRAYLRSLLGPEPLDSAPLQGAASYRAGASLSRLDRLAGGAALMGGLTLLTTLAVAGLQVVQSDLGFRSGMLLAGLLFTASLLALAAGQQHGLGHMAVYPTLTGGALIAISSLPIIAAGWDLMYYGILFLSVGKTLLGLSDWITKTRRFPLRGMLPMITGGSLLLAPLMPVSDAFESASVVTLCLGWVWLGASLWRKAGRSAAA